MHIRPATPSDFSSTASLSVPCFWNDEIYEYTNPYREQYPDQFRSLFLRRHKLRFVTPGFVFHVAVTDEGDDGHEGEERVVGYAVWERKGNSEAAMKWRGNTWWILLERTLLSAQETYHSLLRLDRSLDPSHLRHFLAEAKSDFQSIPELWKLQNLATDPAFQNRGVASKLLEWGKRQAKRERVPIGLESSMKGRPFYLKSGFRIFGEMRISGFPVEEVPIFLWEPRGLEGRWGMKGDDGGAMRVRLVAQVNKSKISAQA